MSNLLDTCSEIREELVPLEVDRETYLAQCVKEKLELISKKYDKEFDQIIEIFDRQITSDNDLSSLLVSVRRFSDTISSMYNALITEIETYQKNFLNKFQ